MRIILCAILALGPLALAADETQYRAMPWHLVDTWWDIGTDREFESYSVEVSISDEVPADVSLYIAPIGLGKLSGIAFYGGIQTRTDGHTRTDKRLRVIGPGLLFSMWGERSLEAIRPADGGLCQSSGHEGDFVSVRRPYTWTKGTYTYRLVKMDREVRDGQPYTWVGSFLFNHQTDENIFIGALRFKGEKLVLGKSLANFVEIYGKQRPVADIPKLTVTFGNLKVNGEAIANATARAIYPKGVPDYADAKAVDGKLVITVGTPVENRAARDVWVIGGKK